MKVMPWDPEWEKMREDRIRRREASDAAFEAVIQKRQENMKTFDPSKDTLLISSNKKPLTYRGVPLHLRVERYKVAGTVHVVMWMEQYPRTGSFLLKRIERDQNRAAAMRRIKAAIDEHLDARIKKGIAQLDAGQGVERELIEDDPMVAVIPDPEERADYIHSRF